MEEIKGELKGISEKDIEERKSKLKKFFCGWIKDNYDKIFLAVLLVSFIIRLYVFFQTMHQPLWWDEADYLATAKRWAGINPSLIDIWYYRRGFLWSLFCMFFFKFGIGEIGIRFLLSLMSTGTVLVSYFLIRDMFNSKKLALWASIGVSFSWIFLFFTGRLLTNLPSVFFLLVSLLFFWKGYVLKQGGKYMYLFGVMFAITCLIRMQYLYFVVPLIIFLLVKDRLKFLKNKYLWASIGIFFILFIPWIVMAWQHFGNPILDLTNYYLGIKGISQTGETGVGGLDFSKTFYVYFTNLPYMLDGNSKGYSTLLTLSPIYLLFIIGIFVFFGDLILGIDKLFKNEEIQARFFVLISILSSFLFMGYIAPHLEQRYIMEVIPFLFLIAVSPMILVENFLSKKSKFSSTLKIISISLLIALFLLPNLIFASSLIENKKTSYLEVKQAGEWIKENTNPEDIVVSDSLPQITYYAERSNYPFALAYRRDLVHKNESDFDAFVETEKPKYLILSVFEKDPEWAYSYPERHKDLLTTARVYYQNQQPILVIYQFNYSNISN